MQQTTWLQIEKAALTSHPKLILCALLLQYQETHSFLDTINATIRIWKATIQASKGIPLCLLKHILLEALHILTPNINITDWIIPAISTVGNL